LSKAIWQAADDYVQCRPENKDIARIYEAHKPDLVFMQIQAENVVSNDVIRHMARESVVINWTGDMRHTTPSWMYNTGATVTCFSNMRDVNEMKQRGYAAEFLQIGIDPEIFKYWPSTQGNDVVFMANNYGHFPLSGLRKNTANILRQKYGSRFSLLGTGFPAATGNLNGNQKGEAQFYSGSKVAINISHFNVDRYSSDRIFRIMASGCFCLSHHYQGIEKDFKVGQELETFLTPIEMCNKIEYYWQNPEERALIAQNGYRKVHENFTYTQMVENIIKIYNKYKKPSVKKRCGGCGK
jgi:hypothetical protein